MENRGDFVTSFYDDCATNQVKVKGERRYDLENLLKRYQRNPENGLINFKLGTVYYDQGQYRKARDHFAVAYRNKAPKAGYVPTIYRIYSMCLIELKEYYLALIVLEEGKRAYPTYTDLWYLLAFANYKLGRYSKAVSSLQRCLQLGEAPAAFVTSHGVGGFRAYNLLGQIYESMQDYSRAVNAYIQALRLEPGFITAFYPLVRLFLETETSSSRAEQRLEEYFAFPTAGAKAVIADAWFKVGEYRLGLKWIERALQQQPEEAKFLFLRGRCLMRLRQYEDALQNFNKLYNSDLRDEAFGESCLCWWALGNTRAVGKLLKLWGRKSAEGSLRAYQLLHQALIAKTPQVLPKDVLPALYVLVEKILAAEIEHLLPYVLDLLDSVRNERPSLRLGKLLWQYEYWDLASEEFLNCMDESRLDAEGFLILGRLCQSKKLYSEAEQMFQRALILDANLLEVYLSLSNLYLVRAEELMCQSDNIFPGNELLQRYCEIICQARKQLKYR